MGSNPARGASKKLQNLSYSYRSQVDIKRMISRSHTWDPPMDIYETETDLVVRVEIAGMDEKDFSIELKNRRLMITGFRQEMPERRAYHRMEIRFGEFNISIELPASFDTDQVQAVYGEGFLKVTMPKSQPRQILISD